MKQYDRQCHLTTPEARHSLVGPSNLWEMKREFQINFLKNKGLKPEHRLLDLGTGTLRGGIPIIKYLDKGNYWGIETREHVFREGEKELSEAELEKKEPNLLISKDLSTLYFDVKFDYIWAFSVLIHMTDAIAADCFGFVHEHLAGNGFFYANVNIGNHPDGNWQSFPVVSRALDFYEDLGVRNGLTVTDLGTLRSLRHFTGIPSQDLQRMLRIEVEAGCGPSMV